MKAFDKKFGRGFLDSCPDLPGIYTYLDSAGTVIYIGKAKSLKKRLSQYRNASRLKRYRKQRAIVLDAVALKFEVCSDHEQACLKEADLIQCLRPKWNVVGAYYFLYPFIGIKKNGSDLLVCYTTEPDSNSDFELHGAFRSRANTRAFFEAFVQIFGLISPSKKKEKRWSPTRGRRICTTVYSFKQVPFDWGNRWSQFLRGESIEVLEDLLLELLEKPAAKQKIIQIQDDFDSLKDFWKNEILPLSKVRLSAPGIEYPISQKQRDILFLKARLTQDRTPVY